MKTIIFDTETTGLLLPSTAPVEEQPRIIELGAILVEGSKIRKELSQLLYPECSISKEITKITGLTDEDLHGKPTFLAFLPKLKKFFSGAECLICHNAPFDTGMLDAELRRHQVKAFPLPKNVVCTVQEYRHVFGRRPKMTELYERFIGKPLAQTHRALDDVKALHEILVKTKLLESLK